MGRLAAQEMQAIGKRVFGTRESTLAREASAYQVEDLVGANQAVRRIMRSTIETLPSATFDSQPADDEGNEVWSAGQVISHVAGSVFWIDGNIKRITGEPSREPAKDLAALGSKITETPKLLDRGDSLNALDYSAREFGRLIKQLPEDGNFDQPVESKHFGLVSIKGWLLFDLIHHHDHVKQLNELDS